MFRPIVMGGETTTMEGAAGKPELPIMTSKEDGRMAHRERPTMGGGLESKSRHRFATTGYVLRWSMVCSLAFGLLAGAGCVSAKKELDLRLMMQAWETMQREYVDPGAVKSNAVTYGAIGGMVDALGDTGHSTFLTPVMVKSLKEIERGEIKGIGVEIQKKNGQAVVVAPFDNSPAQRAGVRAGEIILKVDGEDVSDWPIANVVERITGPAGTWVHLTLLGPHNGRTRQVTVKRAVIKLHEVTWQFLPGTMVVHLRIASFGVGVRKELRKALAELQEKGATGVILDLRNNPGGLVDEAVGAASQFLTGGNVFVAKDAKGHLTPVPVEKGGIATEIPLVVLINGGTASAGEIVAGALKEAHRATLVGETTFGTGTVLEQFSLRDGSALLLAVEEWLTPEGHSFWHKGLAPQVEVALAAETSPLRPTEERDMTPEQLQASEDRQLLRALELVGATTDGTDGKGGLHGWGKN